MARAYTVDEARLIELHAQGLTLQQMAGVLRVSKSSVGRHLIRLKLSRNEKTEWSAADVQLLREMHKAGAHDREIATVLRCNVGRVGDKRRDLNLPRHTAPRLDIEKPFGADAIDQRERDRNAKACDELLARLQNFHAFIANPRTDAKAA